MRDAAPEFGKKESVCEHQYEISAFQRQEPADSVSGGGRRGGKTGWPPRRMLKNLRRRKG